MNKSDELIEKYNAAIRDYYEKERQFQLSSNEFLVSPNEDQYSRLKQNSELLIESKTKRERAWLATTIHQFLKTYAIRDVNDEKRWNSPDASMLEALVELLNSHLPIKQSHYPNSSWESGGYAPYTSTQGKMLHNQILEDIKRLILRCW